MEGKIYTITAGYSCKAHFEIRVNAEGYSFMVIYGEHINGGFICLPEWGIACEASDAKDEYYNTESLTNAAMKLENDEKRKILHFVAEYIARAISEFSVIAK